MYHVIKARHGCSSSYGKNEGIFLIWVAGACLLSPWNVIQKHLHTCWLKTRTLWDSSNDRVSQKRTLKAIKNFLLSLMELHVQPNPTKFCRIRCRLLSRREGLGPEIAPKSPEENKRTSWLLTRSRKVYLTFLYLTYFGIRFNVSGFLQSAEYRSWIICYNMLQYPQQVWGIQLKAKGIHILGKNRWWYSDQSQRALAASLPGTFFGRELGNNCDWIKRSAVLKSFND